MGSPSATREGLSEGRSIEQHLSLDLARGLTSRYGVEKRSLSRYLIGVSLNPVLATKQLQTSRSSHESGETARLDDAADVVEEDLVLAANLDRVEDIFEGEQEARALGGLALSILRGASDDLPGSASSEDARDN